MLTERRLSLVDDIIVFKNSPKFYPIVITEVTVTYDFSYFGRKTSEFKWKYLQYHGLDNALIKFRIRLPQELRFTSSLLFTNPYGNKTDKTKSESLFAEK